jgi:hypothetical protein
MTPGRLHCALAGPLMLLAAACTSAGTGSGDLAEALPNPGETLPPVPCNALIIDGANYADELALHREDQMKLMRFGSEDAMNGYIAETQRLRAEANRITMRLEDILEKYRGIPDYHFIKFKNPAAEEAAARIAAADACADEALK